MRCVRSVRCAIPTNGRLFKQCRPSSVLRDASRSWAGDSFDKETDVADLLSVSNPRRKHQLHLQERHISNSSSRNKMMCNPPSVLQQRQRLHRRQNSTPVAFEALQVPHLSPTVQRHNSHRRGQSLDQRSPIRGQYRQTGSTVSITNTGSANIGQQILREAQQQKSARPGQQNHTAVSLQCDAFQDQPLDQNGLYNANTLNALAQEQDIMQVQSPMQQYFPQDMSMPSSAGLEGMDPIVDENRQHYFQPTHSVGPNFGDDMNERRMSQPDLQLHVRQRPITPAQQTNSGKLEVEGGRKIY